MDRTSEIAKSIATRSKIKNPDLPGFKKTGEAAADVIAGYIKMHKGLGALDVLDFGAGSGRVVTPLARRLPNTNFAATDVDAEAVDYIKLTAPENVSSTVNPYEGPLPYPDGSFDVVYSISVWSHLPAEKGKYWLEEVRRVLKPGGVAVLSYAGATTMRNWINNLPAWKSESVSELPAKQFIYREFVNLSKDPEKYPGVTSSWGNTAIHPDYVRREWSKIMTVLDVVESGMNGQQDLAVLTKD